MEVGFQDEIHSRIDAKGRISVPAAFRRVLEAGDPSFSESNNARMHILIWPHRKCIEVYTQIEFEKLRAEVDKLVPRSPKRRALTKIIATGSKPLQLDDTGRVVIPERMRVSAGLDENIVLAGMFQIFEIWSPEAYELDKENAIMEVGDDIDNPFAELYQNG